MTNKPLTKASRPIRGDDRELKAQMMLQIKELQDAVELLQNAVDSLNRRL